MRGRRWAWLFLLAIVSTVFVFRWSQSRRSSEPRSVTEVELKQQRGPEGWEAVASRVQSFVQPYFKPLQKKNPVQVAEKWIQEHQTLRVGKTEMKMKLSTDWLYIVNVQNRTAGFVALRGVRTGTDLAREVSRRQKNSGAVVQLVFTEKDADPVPENRIVMTERLHLHNPPASLAKQMQETLGLILNEEPAYAPGIKIYSAASAMESLAALESLQGVQAHEPTPVLAWATRPAAAPNDPLYPTQWHLKATNQTSADGGTMVTVGADCHVEDVWGYPDNNGYRGRGVTIAILDDGVQLGHPDLAQNISSTGHYDFWFPSTDQTRGSNRDVWQVFKNTNSKGVLNFGQESLTRSGVWINEFLSKTDAPTSQFIEVVVGPNVSTDLENILIHFYNGETGNETTFSYTGVSVPLSLFSLRQTTISGYQIFTYDLSAPNYPNFSLALEVGGLGIVDAITVYNTGLATGGPATGVQFKNISSLAVEDYGSNGMGKTTSFQLISLPFLSAGNPIYPDNNHGTAVAGVAAARGNNTIGSVGVAPEASLVSYRILGEGPYEGTARADNLGQSWVPADILGSGLGRNNASLHIKNNSWTKISYYSPFDSLEANALANARASGRSSLGTIIIFAAGNFGQSSGRSDYQPFPADLGVIHVGALDHTGAKAAYSNPGSSILVSAPSGNWFPGGPTTTTTDRVGPSGYNVNSANNDHSNLDYTASFNGTSSATPVVSGVVALMLEANPGLGWRDVQEILVRTARKNAPQDSSWAYNGAGFRVSHNFGFGCVDAGAAVQMAASWANNLPSQVTRGITNNSSVPIGNNNGTTATMTFEIPFDSRVRCESVSLTLSITHPSRGDLRIELVSPHGTVSTLAAPFGSDQMIDNLNNWTFRTVQSWGERDAGLWILRVRDEQAGQSGTAILNSATLNIYGVNATNSPLAPSFIRLAAGSSVQEHALINSVAAVIESSDEDGADVISLTSGSGDTHNELFEVSGKNLLLKQAINFKDLSGGFYDVSSGTYFLKIRLRATEATGLYSTQREVMLPVIPQNDYRPLDFYLADSLTSTNLISGKSLVLLGSKPFGVFLGRFRAVDLDRTDISGDTYSYALVAGNGSQDNGKFQIVGDELRSAEILSPLTLFSYLIRVRATDSGGDFIDKAFQVYQTPSSSPDSDEDGWPDNIELAKTGSLDHSPTGDLDGDNQWNAFDVNPLAPMWNLNAVFLSSSWLLDNNFAGLSGWIHVAKIKTVASAYDDLQVATYELVTGSGDNDNAKFRIIGDDLYLAGPITEALQAGYRLRIQATRQDNPWYVEANNWSSVTSPLGIQVVHDPDEDADYLPDAWESSQFGNLSQGPWGDADGDGCPNRLEYVSGSDATNAAVTGSTGVRQWGYLGFLDPVPAEATNLVSMASGWRHMVGIRSNGTVVAWGYNNAGEIAVPAGLTNVLAVAAGKEFSVALKGDGTVVGWGLNDYGQADAKSFLPLKIREIAAGNAHVVARMEDGTVRVWGGGDGVSQLPAGLSGVRSVAAGTDSGMVVQADRTALGWGFSQTNTGLDGKYGQAKAPASLTNARALAFGGFHTLALGTNGTVTAWGSNSDGQSTVPASATNVVKIAAGLNSWHSLALRADGTVLGWGAAAYAGAVPSDLTNAVDIAGGYFHGAALAAAVTTQAPPNRPPTDITLSLSGGSVPENTAFGATIGLFVVADPDSGDGQTLSLASGSGDSDNWMVQVSGMSLLLNTSLNYEFKSSLAIRVRTTDAVGNIYEKSFVVPVGNILTDDDDYDGLTEAEEIAFGTSTSLQDTDNDGFLDYAEKMAGSAGNNASKIPNEIKDFLKFQTMTNGPETRSFVFFTRMNHKHTVMSSTNLVTWTNDATIYPTNPFIGNGRHTNMSIYTYSPKFFMKIITVTNSNSTIHPPGGGGMGPGM